jgi:Ca-activated chloride channel family protein
VGSDPSSRSPRAGRQANPEQPPSLTRRGLLGGIVAAWAVGTGALLIIPPPPSPNVEVVHWANGHMMNLNLLPKFAGEFNNLGRRTQSGKPITVSPVVVNSADITNELIARVQSGAALNAKLANPTVVTPAADHWLPLVNHAVGKTVIDRSSAQVMATTWIGIVTYREMAEAIGWPKKEIGIADVVKLASDPKGWAAVGKARAEWGSQKPLLAFTDPSTSSTGRSMLFTLYAIGAGKAPEALTAEDVTRPEVVNYVKSFQRSVDHYVYDTLTLNSKIFQGPRYGHFFFVSESNLVQLYQGKLAVTVGADVTAKPLTRQMVFIYPAEGSTTHNHSAHVVQAPWVTPEHAEAAQQWIRYLREEAQQRAFLQEGFRPATSLPLGDPVSGRFGLDPTKPTVVRNTDSVEPDVAEAIVGSWDEVKKPGIAVFVVDVSGSMDGPKLTQAKEGLIRALDGMSQRNGVGLLTFSSGIVSRVPVSRLSDSKFELGGVIDRMRATGNTALYDAIVAGIEMADRAEGEADTIRGVVVITDGKANEGTYGLDDLVEMISKDEVRIRQFRGWEKDTAGIDANGKQVPKADIVGNSLALKTSHPMHIFFVGVGKDAASAANDVDWDVGRILAQATGSSIARATAADLATVIEQYSKYF